MNPAVLPKHAAGTSASRVNLGAKSGALGQTVPSFFASPQRPCRRTWRSITKLAASLLAFPPDAQRPHPIELPRQSNHNRATEPDSHREKVQDGVRPRSEN